MGLNFFLGKRISQSRRGGICAQQAQDVKTDGAGTVERAAGEELERILEGTLPEGKTIKKMQIFYSIVSLLEN